MLQNYFVLLMNFTKFLMLKYWIVVLLQLCFLSISCGEKGAKQVAPAQDHVILKFENNEDGKYSQSMIAQIIKHFHLPNNTVVLLLLHHS